MLIAPLLNQSPGKAVMMIVCPYQTGNRFHLEYAQPIVSVLL